MKRIPPLTFLLLLVIAPAGCLYPGERVGATTTTSKISQCGFPLGRKEIIAVAQRALKILWGDSSLDGFDVRIEPAGCDYHFFAIRKGTEAAEDIFFSIDRTARVNSPPECWWLGDLGNCTLEDQNSQ